MRNFTKIFVFIMISVFTILTTISYPGNSGKIKGIVTDSKTGRPIPGASVHIMGTTMGAMTDPDGKYLVRLVPPGTYALGVTSVSYSAVKIDSVIVKADITTEQNVVLYPEIASFDKIIKVTADRAMINKFETASKLTTKEIQAKPIQNVDRLLRQTAGVVTNSDGEILIRGGRAGEVAYIVDGVNIGDPLGGAGPSQLGLSLTSPSRTSHKPSVGIPKPIADNAVNGCAPTMFSPPPANGGNQIVNGKKYDAMFFKDYGTNPFVDAEDDHLSTFAIDVDDASYVMTRSYLERGSLPPDEAIRTEEFINHFDYNYTPPRYEPFSVDIEGAPSYFGENCEILKIGIQGKTIYEEDRKPANLVFVIDVSGSMQRENRLALVKRALRALVDNLRYDDKVGIVAYGSHAQRILNPTSIRHSDEILAAIESLHCNGSTNAEAGLMMGYKMAKRNLNRDKINRVILCSDGVANTGQTSPVKLLKKIKRFAQKGITLTTVGFGMGNYNDILMEKLGNKGDGMYAYVDDFKEARRVFIDNLTGMLQVIARDVKIQVDFNPEIVRSYRLLGYENRDVADNKFRDDAEDGGEIGAGHQTTALYELKFHDNADRGHIGTIFVRYKKPDNLEVDETAKSILRKDFNSSLDKSSNNLKLSIAAAEFAEILGKSYWAKTSQLEDVESFVRDNFLHNDNEKIKEFRELIGKAIGFNKKLAKD